MYIYQSHKDILNRIKLFLSKTYTEPLTHCNSIQLHKPNKYVLPYFPHKSQEKSHALLEESAGRFLTNLMVGRAFLTVIGQGYIFFIRKQLL